MFLFTFYGYIFFLELFRSFIFVLSKQIETFRLKTSVLPLDHIKLSCGFGFSAELLRLLRFWIGLNFGGEFVFDSAELDSTDSKCLFRKIDFEEFFSRISFFNDCSLVKIISSKSSSFGF